LRLIAFFFCTPLRPATEAYALKEHAGARPSAPAAFLHRRARRSLRLIATFCTPSRSSTEAYALEEHAGARHSALAASFHKRPRRSWELTAVNFALPHAPQQRLVSGQNTLARVNWRPPPFLQAGAPLMGTHCNSFCTRSRSSTEACNSEVHAGARRSAPAAGKTLPHPLQAATATLPLTFSRIWSSVAKSAALRKFPRPKSFSYESRSPSSRLNSGRQPRSRSACARARRPHQPRARAIHACEHERRAAASAWG